MDRKHRVKTKGYATLAFICLLALLCALPPLHIPARAEEEAEEVVMPVTGSTRDATSRQADYAAVDMSKPVFVKDIYMSAAANGQEAQNCLRRIISIQDSHAYNNSQYKLLSINLNRGTKSKYCIYIGCTFTNNARIAIKAIGVHKNNDTTSPDTVSAGKLGGRYVCTNFNLNHGNSGSSSYLYYSRYTGTTQSPLSSIGARDDDNCQVVINQDGSLYTSSRSGTRWSGYSRLNRDLNKSSGGDYTYLMYAYHYSDYEFYYGNKTIQNKENKKKQFFYGCNVTTKNTQFLKDIISVDSVFHLQDNTSFGALEEPWYWQQYGYKSGSNVGVTLKLYGGTLNVEGRVFINAAETQTKGGVINLTSGSLGVYGTFSPSGTTAFRGKAPLIVYDEGYFFAPKSFNQGCELLNYGLIEIDGDLLNSAAVYNFPGGCIKVCGYVNQKSLVQNYDDAQIIMEGTYDHASGELQNCGTFVVSGGKYTQTSEKAVFTNRGTFLGGSLLYHVDAKPREGGGISGGSTDGSSAEEMMTKLQVGFGTAYCSVGNGTTSGPVDVSFSEARKNVAPQRGERYKLELAVEASGAVTAVLKRTLNGELMEKAECTTKPVLTALEPLELAFASERGGQMKVKLLLDEDGRLSAECEHFISATESEPLDCLTAPFAFYAPDTAQFTFTKSELAYVEIDYTSPTTVTAYAYYEKDGSHRRIESPTRFTEPGYYELTFTSKDGDGTEYEEKICFTITEENP